MRYFFRSLSCLRSICSFDVSSTNGRALYSTHFATRDYQREPAKLRRVLFSVPGHDDRKLAKACDLGVDSVVLDLEDGVPVDRKKEAREKVFHALENTRFGRSEVCVRMNSMGSGFELDDLRTILKSNRLEAIIIPKVTSGRDVNFVSHMVDLIGSDETRKKIRFLAAIESAKALLHIKKIAKSDPRMDGLVFASEDYCADTGITRTSHRRELLFARSTVVNAAHANGLNAIDIVCIDYKNEDVLQEECQEGREMGFTGKQAIHPSQIAKINEIFSPSIQQKEYAQKIIDGYKRHSHSGMGAFDLDGKVIDIPIVKWAEKIIKQSEYIDRK